MIPFQEKKSSSSFKIYEIQALLSLFAWKVHMGKVEKDKKIPTDIFLNSSRPKWKRSFLYYDSEGNIAEFFDNKSGWTLTSDVLEFFHEKPTIRGDAMNYFFIGKGSQGVRWTGRDSERRGYPALMDIGVMKFCTTCSTCGVGCYQKASKRDDSSSDSSGNPSGDMSMDMYKKIIDEIKEHTFQVALGGAGNVNFHKNFKELLEYTYAQGLVPNYTTAMLLDKEQISLTKKYCGAVAISYHPMREMRNGTWENNYWECQEYTRKSVENALMAGITTNIHYVLSNESIDYAIHALENNLFPQGVNAIVFLRYKPVGYGIEKKCLREDDEKVKRFFSIINMWNSSEHNDLSVGFDSCMVPLLEKYCSHVDPRSILPCEASSQSAYVTPEGFILPCSFGNQEREWYKFHSVKEAWDSEMFHEFKKHPCPWVK